MTREHPAGADCAAFDALLAERASGTLADADEAAVSAHLASCAGCAASYDEYVEVLDLARVAPPSTAPAVAASGPVALTARRRPRTGEADLAGRVLHAWNVRRRQRLAALALSGGFAAAAALTLLVFTPALRHPRSASAAAPAVAAWSLPSGEEPEVAAAVDGLDDTYDGEEEALAGGFALATDEADALP